MRLLAACGVMIGVAVVAAFAGQGAREKIGPRLNVEFDVVDLGSITDSKPAVVTMRFTNVGDEPLEVYWAELPHGGTRGGMNGSPTPAMEIYVDGATGLGMVGPRLSIQPQIYEGYLNADGTCTVTIPFVNTGDVALEIYGAEEGV
ncbi:hypothetical protein LBMAG48_19500 [Phycisphaerae bacterium]|nr:hypothetical protein LBMAG48_19500 [Phycisphaerae bacterium]